MSQQSYSVIFRGDLIEGFTVSDVKSNFARLFKAGPEAVEKLFSGRPLAIKKGLSEAQAQQLHATLSKLGARSVVRSEAEAAPAPAPQARPEPAVVAAPSPSPEVQNEVEREVERKVESEAGAPGGLESGLTLAPMEGYLLKEHERNRVESQAVPVSHLSLRPAEGNLVEASEQPAKPVVPVIVPNWKVDTVATFKVAD